MVLQGTSGSQRSLSQTEIRGTTTLLLNLQLCGHPVSDASVKATVIPPFHGVVSDPVAVPPIGFGQYQVDVPFPPVYNPTTNQITQACRQFLADVQDGYASQVYQNVILPELGQLLLLITLLSPTGVQDYCTSHSIGVYLARDAGNIFQVEYTGLVPDNSGGLNGFDFLKSGVHAGGIDVTTLGLDTAYPSLTSFRCASVQAAASSIYLNIEYNNIDILKG